MARSQAPPRSRVVLLGASNLHLGLGVVLAELRARLAGPLDVLVACGHGRSYGDYSTIPIRTLPSILDCGLWAALASREPLPTYVVVTDVGNDLLYGDPPGRVLQWVDACFERFTSHAVSVAICDLPIENLRDLSVWRYRTFRALFFPFCRVSLTEMSRRAAEVSQGLATIAEERGTKLVLMQRRWYGIDPIHFSWRSRREAWRAVVDALCGGAGESSALTFAERRRLYTSAAHERWIVGLHRAVQQPSCVLDEGSHVSQY